MPIPLKCPGCGWAEKLPDHLMGKKLKCKRCQHAFIVGSPAASPRGPGQPGAVRARPAPPPAAGAIYEAEVEIEDDVEFAEDEPRRSRRRKQGSGVGLIVGCALLGLLLGGGAMAGYLYFTKPSPATDDQSASGPAAPAEPKFTRDKSLANPPVAHNTPDWD